MVKGRKAPAPPRLLTEDEVCARILKLQWRLTHREAMAFVRAVQLRGELATAFVNERMAGRALSEDDVLAVLRAVPAAVGLTSEVGNG